MVGTLWSNVGLVEVENDDSWYGWLLLIVGTSVGSDGWYLVRVVSFRFETTATND